MRPIDGDALKKSIKEDEELKSSSVAYLLMNLMTCYIDDAPTIDAELVRHGHWIKGEHWSVTCSECGCLGIAHDGKDYCPYCGADMRGTEDENDE